jgi:glutathione synthase/RimK-type ligase-like ATP-grasp enzyme
MNTATLYAPISLFESEFCGLAPFARMSLTGGDVLPIAKTLLSRAETDGDNANLLMNLSNAMQSLGQHDLGVSIQAQALALQRVYLLKATRQPAKFRLLILLIAGDIAENTPIDCLLEDMDIDIIFYYLAPDNTLADPIPEHDVVMVGICDSDENSDAIQALIPVLADWSKPVINKPQYIANTGRKVASLLLQGTAGLLMPPTLRVLRTQLTSVAQGTSQLSDWVKNTNFPIILRPVGSHAGRNLERINDTQAIADYLERVEDSDFFISRFIDYSAADGLFRKFRVVLIDGKPFIAHMATSSHWMIHYVNAGMYDDGKKRAEEAYVMAHFDQFIAHHQKALDAIYQRTKLDYVGIDCAETSDGKLLVFEIDHVMVVHDMDPPALFPYKHKTMLKAKNAFRDMLSRLTQTSSTPATPNEIGKQK